MSKPFEEKEKESKEDTASVERNGSQENVSAVPTNNDTATELVDQKSETGAEDSNLVAELSEPGTPLSSMEENAMSAVAGYAQDGPEPVTVTGESTSINQTEAAPAMDDSSSPLINVDDSEDDAPESTISEGATISLTAAPSNATETVESETTADDSSSPTADIPKEIAPDKESTANVSGSEDQTLLPAESSEENDSITSKEETQTPEVDQRKSVEPTLSSEPYEPSQDIPASSQSNVTSSESDETHITDYTQEQTDETVLDAPQGDLIGVHDGDEQDEAAKDGGAEKTEEDSEEVVEDMEAFEEEIEKEEEMAQELEEDESTWHFAGRIDECSRFGVSPSEGIVFVCDQAAYVCGEDIQFRERFLLLLEDPVVDGCDLGEVLEIYSSRGDCNFFPKNEHHLKRDGRQEEQVVLCPNGSTLSSYYMFCSQELDNYYCDGDTCETCEEVSRRQRYLRH